MTLKTILLAATLTILASTGISEASWANFRITAVGVGLGKPEDADISKYIIKPKVGQQFSLVAEGIVLPRGGDPSPGDIDAGARLSDDVCFKIVSPEAVKVDKTKCIVALEAIKAGKSRVRFVGDILGRYHKYDVIVNVSER